MPPEEPGWWYATDGSGDMTRRALAPLGKAWGYVAERRYRWAQPYRSKLPVICVGNFTAGGTGKTPLSMALAGEIAKLGRKPAFLTRGYPGRRVGPAWVDAANDTSGEVGDEALLLARHAPTLVARDRKSGAVTIEKAGHAFDTIVMDDGLQNPSLDKDLKIALVDAKRGFGNGEVVPAGPLRAALPFQLGLVDCIVINRGSDKSGVETPVETRLKQVFPGPVIAAHVEPAGETSWLTSARVHAYAGIAHPERFFMLIEQLGADVRARTSFADHHAFTNTDAQKLLDAAEKDGAQLITTEKDIVRLTSGTGDLAKLRSLSRTLPIRLIFDDRELERLRALLGAAVKQT